MEVLSVSLACHLLYTNVAQVTWDQSSLPAGTNYFYGFYSQNMSIPNVFTEIAVAPAVGGLGYIYSSDPSVVIYWVFVDFYDMSSEV